MRLETDNDKIIVYLKKELIGSIDFSDMDNLENYFKNIFLKLKNIYEIELKGYYNINVYIDKIYGIVLELIQENIEYGEYLNQIEMRIIPINTTFLYLIDDLIKIENTNLYYYKNNIYLSCNENISKNDYIKVMDHAKIVYNNTDNIINYGKHINHFNFNKIMI